MKILSVIWRYAGTDTWYPISSNSYPRFKWKGPIFSGNRWIASHAVEWRIAYRLEDDSDPEMIELFTPLSYTFAPSTKLISRLLHPDTLAHVLASWVHDKMYEMLDRVPHGWNRYHWRKFADYTHEFIHDIVEHRALDIDGTFSRILLRMFGGIQNWLGRIF